MSGEDNGGWSDLFPEGRVLFYEGNDPAGFAEEMRKEHDFDPAGNREAFDKYMRANYGGTWEQGPFTAASGFAFMCPAELLDEIYGTGRYRIGS